MVVTCSSVARPPAPLVSTRAILKVLARHILRAAPLWRTPLLATPTYEALESKRPGCRKTLHDNASREGRLNWRMDAESRLVRHAGVPRGRCDARAVSAVAKATGRR